MDCLQGFLSFEGNLQFLGDEGVPSVDIPCCIFTKFMFDHFLQVLCEEVVVVHAGIELVIPINGS